MQYEPPYGAPGADDPYVNGDPSIARQGSIIPAAAVEYPQREIVNLIEKSGYTPSDLDLFQLTRSVRKQFVNFAVDTGAANAMSVALDPPLEAYLQGMPLRVLVSQDNTGNVTINVNGLGPRQVVRTNGAQLQPGDIRGGMLAQLVDDGTRFQLTNYLGATGGGTSNTYLIHIPYAEDTSATPSTITVAFTPAITTVAAGDLIEVWVANDTSGATTIAINALAAQPIRRNDGQPLQAKDIGAGENVLLEWNKAGYWQLTRLARSQVVLKLPSASLTLYVNASSGSDSNDGHDPAHAFKTIMGAINYVQNSFLIAGRTVTLQLAIGTYTGADVTINNVPGNILIKGDPSNKLAYVIQGNTGGSVEHNTVSCQGSGSTLTLQGVTMQATSTTSNMCEADYNGVISLIDVAFTGPTIVGSQMAAFNGGQIIVYNNIDIYNNCTSVIGLFDAGFEAGLWYVNINNHGITVTQGWVTLTNSYAAISYGWTNFSGSAYGPRYALYLNAVLNTGGGPSNYIPGSTPGGADASSVYG